MNIQKWLKDNTTDLSSKTIAITGSTGGLAKHLVSVFASLNANLILINRNKEKTQKQIAQLKEAYPNISIEFVECNLSNFDNVKSATEQLKSKEIDILYLAAGVYNVPRFKTKENYDNIFQTNFISHYYITKELLPQLNKRNGHIVAISSIAHNYSTLDENDIDFKTRKKASKVYGNSKRFLTFSLHELMKHQQSKLSVVHPGVTLTDMTNHYPKAINWLVKIFIKLLFPSTQKACLSLIKGIFEITENSTWIGPKLFNIWGKPKKQKIKNSNIEEIKKIYNIAENIYNELKFGTQKNTSL